MIDERVRCDHANEESSPEVLLLPSDTWHSHVRPRGMGYVKLHNFLQSRASDE